MASLAAAQSEDFARLFFREIEACAEAGTWIPSSAAFIRTVERHEDHPYVAYIAARPGRRIGFTAVCERIRTAEFGHIERRKTGYARNAPVFFRVRTESRVLIPMSPPAAAVGAARYRPSALRLLHRALAMLERACSAFDWQQPTWSERLVALGCRLLPSLRGRLSRDRHRSSSAA